LKTHVTQYVKGCTTCQSTKPLTHRPKPPIAPLEPREQETDNVPFQVISMDLITDLPLSDGNDSILTIVDHDCSKAAIFLPCTKEISTEGVIDLYAKHVFPHYGVPQQIISNRDPRFVSNLARGICEKLGISQNISTAYHPQTDGQSERANQRVEQYLRIYTNDHQNNWLSILPIAQFVHNTWLNVTMGYTPLELLIGYTSLVNMAKTLDQLPYITQRAEMLGDL
jgi:hypothetical protein